MEKQVNTNKDLLMLSLSRFYTQDDNVNIIKEIIDGKHSISLRLLDWFVTNYSKKYNTCIENVDGSYFKVYLSYRSQLKAYSKQQFDPFRRRERITFIYHLDKSIETTIGQLNFFKWVIENRILNYVEENITNIENDMINAHKKKRKDDMVNTTEIYTTTSTMNKMHIPMVISFN